MGSIAEVRFSQSGRSRSRIRRRFEQLEGRLHPEGVRSGTRYRLP